MSVVESPIETKEMPKTTEIMESFGTVDEDKDSDEESFHLFLEGDDEQNKSDDKVAEFEIETIKEVIQEKESENIHILQEEKVCKDPAETIPKVDAIESNLEIENVQCYPDKLEKGNDENTETSTSLHEEKLAENVSDNSSLVTSNPSNSKETVTPVVHESSTIDDQLINDSISENEDDILDKHVNECSDEIGNGVEELDPNIEESLLNECEELENNETDKTCENNHDTDILDEVKETKVTESAVQNKSGQVVLVNGMETSTLSKHKDISEKKSSSDTISHKCDENSSSSNPDSEDLLDISMIKDSAQDDADIAEDARQLEQENYNSNSKALENVDQVDDTSNSDNSDEDVRIEPEIFESVQNEQSNSEKEKDVEESSQEDCTNKLEESECAVEENSKTLGTSIVDDGEEIKDKPAKRNLSESEEESSSKRIKLVDTVVSDNDMNAWDITELQSLISFSKFMTQSHLKKLTRADLEEFCIQKLCEAILHKSELGETNHQLKIQEQTIETLRRDQAVLTKQIKDLEIVNKKLMNEILTSNGVKPVLPVKITRSVGLQVRLPAISDLNTVKRRSLPTNQKINGPQNPVIAPKPRPPNNTTNRVVMQPSPQKQQTQILNKVLQTRNKTPVKSPQLQNNTAQKPNSSSKTIPPSPPEKRSKPSGSFIDLTDEDDKKVNKNVKSIVPQGVRISAVPKTTVSSVLPSVVSTTTPQLMYVVQQNTQLKQGVLTTSAGQKAVLVNFQPTNGVINTLNTSSVSVIPKAGGNIPLKPKPIPQNSLLKVSKHPAPLPSPPAIQGPNDKNLKSIPPKPVLSIRKTNTGIILQWRMPYDLGNYEAIASYQLYAYQETSAIPSTDMWRKVGDVKAMALPMACTLTQFADKNRYYFAVRPVDIHKRIGKFSLPVLSE